MAKGSIYAHLCLKFKLQITWWPWEAIQRVLQHLKTLISPQGTSGYPTCESTPAWASGLDWGTWAHCDLGRRGHGHHHNFHKPSSPDPVLHLPTPQLLKVISSPRSPCYSTYRMHSSLWLTILLKYHPLLTLFWQSWLPQPLHIR